MELDFHESLMKQKNLELLDFLWKIIGIPDGTVVIILDTTFSRVIEVKF